MPPRLVRWQDRGHTHFLTFSCYDRNPYLLDDHPKQVFLQTLETLRLRHRFHVFGYVLMPEHVHLLLSEPEHHMLADTMRALKTQTSKALRGDRPQFWQRRYYDFNIFTNEKRTEKLRYLHRNPVLRGLVNKPED